MSDERIHMKMRMTLRGDGRTITAVIDFGPDKEPVTVGTIAQRACDKDPTVREDFIALCTKAMAVMLKDAIPNIAIHSYTVTPIKSDPST